MSPAFRFGTILLTGAVLLGPAPRPGSAHGRAAGPRVDPPGERLSANPTLAVIRPAPDFTLLDPEGRVVRRSDFQGRVVLLSFLYTSCPTACPLISQRMALLQSRLRAARAFPSRVALLAVTVDAERDSAAVLARYARGFRAESAAWPFLRESPDRLRPVLTAYDEWTRSFPNGEIEHPARLYLIDGHGQIREIYSVAWFDERQAFLDIQALLREPR